MPLGYTFYRKKQKCIPARAEKSGPGLFVTDERDIST
jgi:hypothetical protein